MVLGSIARLQPGAPMLDRGPRQSPARTSAPVLEQEIPHWNTGKQWIKHDATQNKCYNIYIYMLHIIQYNLCSWI